MLEVYMCLSSVEFYVCLKVRADKDISGAVEVSVCF
jgi:hypothetical protein